MIRAALFFLLLIAPMTSSARLLSISLGDWDAAYSRVAPKIIVDCDCIVTENPDGTKNVSFNKFRFIKKVGNEISCVIANPSDFLTTIASNPMSLLYALFGGGGASWSSYDNGVTWRRITPGNSVPEVPDAWCLQRLQ